MKKLKNYSGVTLIEILIGIVISVIIMGAMYASYTAINNSYSQVTDKAKASQIRKKRTWNDDERFKTSWI